MELMIRKILSNYLPHLKVEIEDLKIKNLPLFYKGNYIFKKLIINDNPYAVVCVKDENLGPRQFKKHGQIIQEKANIPVIWYMHKLHYNKVQRLIENRMDFIVEEGQVHLPSINISIKPEQKKQKPLSLKLNEWEINILCRQIIKDDLDGKNKQNIANIFGITKMTVGRAIEKLILNELCFEKKSGVYKYIYFKDKHELWDFFKKNIPNPIKELVFFKNKTIKAPLSGISALSKHTMLSDDTIKTYAIGRKDYIKHYANRDIVFEDDAGLKLEVWNRKPIFLKNGTINPLDIYLILKDDVDERVQIELESLLKKYGLG